MSGKFILSFYKQVAATLDDPVADCLLSELTSTSLEESRNIGQQMQRMITSLVAHLHREEQDWKKNILIFLPTYKALEEQWSLLKQKGINVKVFVLHSSVDMDHSLQAMEVSLQVRKVKSLTHSCDYSFVCWATVSKVF